jgi:Predicted O-methyltransferase
MKRISKTFRGLLAIARNPWLLNRVLSADDIWKNYLEKKYKKFSLPVVEIDELIPNFCESVSLVFLSGGSLPTDIALLQALSKKFQACKYFEIGTWRGESVMNVADYAEVCYTLNLSKEELLKAGQNETYADQQGFLSKNKKNILHLEGNSLSFDFSKLDQKFDLVFIDGDHRYEYVKNDTEKIFKYLLHENSIVVWHDYGYDPENIRFEVGAGILDGTPTHFHGNLYHVSNTLCAIFTRQKLHTLPPLASPFPDKIFKVDLETHRLAKA